MQNKRTALLVASLVLITAGFMISLISKCAFWSIRFETGAVNKPNWLRIRYLIFYGFPMAMLLVHILVNRKKEVQAFYTFSCILMAANGALRCIEFITESKDLKMAAVCAVLCIAFIACAAETQQHSKKRILPLFLLMLCLVLHSFTDIMSTRALLKEAADTAGKERMLPLWYFLAESGVIFFDIAAFLMLLRERQKETFQLSSAISPEMERSPKKQ